MDEMIRIGDRVQVHFDARFGEREGWYEGTVFKIDPYSDHRGFYWVDLDAAARTILGIQQISVLNPKNIRKVDSSGNGTA
jgi:hypothetical protein